MYNFWSLFYLILNQDCSKGIISEAVLNLFPFLAELYKSSCSFYRYYLPLYWSTILNRPVSISTKKNYHPSSHRLREKPSIHGFQPFRDTKARSRCQRNNNFPRLLFFKDLKFPRCYFRSKNAGYHGRRSSPWARVVSDTCTVESGKSYM